MSDGNGADGIELDERGPGDIRASTTIANARANGNGVDGGDGGVKIREKGTGELDATLEDVTALNNQINGIHIREDAVATWMLH